MLIFHTNTRHISQINCILEAINQKVYRHKNCSAIELLFCFTINSRLFSSTLIHNSEKCKSLILGKIYK